MGSRWLGRRPARGLLCGLLVVGLSLAAHAVDIVGTQVTIAWTPASGPVLGYYVIVSRNGSPARVESTVAAPQATVAGALGETVVVQAAAFGADGVAGPLSPPSPPIRFVRARTGKGQGRKAQPLDAALQEATAAQPAEGDAGTPRAARDFNGDGRADLVVQRGNALRLWVMDGSHVASEIPLPNAPDGSVLVGTGDYDANRSSDLLWEDSRSGQLVLWLLDAGVVVDTGVLDRSSVPVDEEWHVGGSADFDGDRADDVMLFSRVRGEVEIWALGGPAVQERSRLSGHAGAWSVAAAADTEGDGRAEIVWLDELERVLERRDPAAAAPLVLGDLSAGWRVVAAPHLDGAGAARLLAWQASTGATQAWTLDAQGIAAVRALPSSQAVGDFAGSGDYDGDGREDLVWSDPANGTIRLWLTRAGAPAAVIVDRVLPADGVIVSGARGSDDSAFRARLCDLNAKITSRQLQSCLAAPHGNKCDAADLDSDGAVTAIDAAIWQLRASGQGCDGA